jgi:hypothetical protein
MNAFARWTESLKLVSVQKLLFLLELILIVGWAIWVGRGMLNFNESHIPPGREYGMAVSTHHFWTFVQSCGWCALWDGSQIGGFPALANVYAAVIHPVTMVTTLIWGVVNGSKMIVVLSLIFAGLAQWWLAAELHVGWLARLWSALLAVVGGHLAGKLDLGVVDLVLSTALSSFVFPAVLMLRHRQDWRSTVVLALVVASSILAGQGYVQIFLLLTLPAFGFLLLGPDWKLSPLWKKYAAAAGLAVMIGATLILPVVHNGWNIHKELNPSFSTVQPLKFSLLNFVVDDFEYFTTDALGKAGIPSLYINFIGWLPLILGIFAVGAARDVDRRHVFYLAASATIIIALVDVTLLQALARWMPFIASVRFPTFALGIAVTPILGLAAYGLEQVVKRVQWPFLAIGVGSQGGTRTLSIPLSLILLIPLALAVRQPYAFGRTALTVQPTAPETMMRLADMRTESLQWVLPIFGEHFWKEPAVRLGLKITSSSLPFWTGAKHYPEPYYELTRGPLENPDEDIVLVKQYENEFLYQYPDVQYAVVIDSQGNATPCPATGTGGEIDVTCNAPAGGRLVVHENAWSAWKLWVDEKRAELMDSDGWLAAKAPAGKHTFTFRYRPWDVPLGLFVTAVGLALCGWLWFRKQADGLEQNNP